MQSITLLKPRAGTLRALVLFVALPVISGCGDGLVLTGPAETSQPAPGTSTPPPTPTAPTGSGSLLVSGVMTSQYQGIRVSRGGAPVTNADVTVNGFRIQHYSGDLYSGSLPQAVRAGDMLNLKVVAGGVSFEAAGEVAPTPTITAPAAGSTFASTDSFSLGWDTSADPDRFEVCLNCWENSLYGAIYPAPGSAREFKIVPGALVDFGGGAVVAVYAFKSDFLKVPASPEVASNVLFMARSRDALINITY